MYSSEQNKMVINRRLGFTLIELLVVISIIALLLSILMPALTKVKEQARSIVCKANLKQITLASILYANENNDKFISLDTSLYGYWLPRIAEYLEVRDEDEGSISAEELNVNFPIISMKVGLCPVANRIERSLIVPNSVPYAPGRARNSWLHKLSEGSYGINWFMQNEWEESAVASFSEWEDKSMFFRKLSDTKSNTPLFADSVWPDFAPWGMEGLIYGWALPVFPQPPFSGSAMSSSANGFNRIILDRHNMGINLSLADGSARTVKPLKGLGKLKWNAAFINADF